MIEVGVFLSISGVDFMGVVSLFLELSGVLNHCKMLWEVDFPQDRFAGVLTTLFLHGVTCKFLLEKHSEPILYNLLLLR